MTHAMINPPVSEGYAIDAAQYDRYRGRHTAWPEPLETTPDDDQLEEWVMDSVCEATDGCEVEPDGQCPHGYPSWLIFLGMI